VVGEETELVASLADGHFKTSDGETAAQ